MIFHLLIVDDEPTIRKGLSTFIQWDSLDCVVDGTASDGAEAIGMIQDKRPDIIITDIRMPQIDGIALAQYVHEHMPEVKVILLTGYADFQYAQSAIRFGVSDFILKPTSREKLQDAVKKAQETIVEYRNRTMVSEEDFLYLREQLFQEITAMEQLPQPVYVKALRYGIELKKYYAAAFQLNEFLAMPEGESSAVLKDALWQQEGKHYVYSFGSHLILWIYAAEGENGQKGAERLAVTCREILETMDSLYALKLSAGISSCHCGLAELPAASKEAISAGNMNFYEDCAISFYDPSKGDGFCHIDSEYTLDLYQFENCLKTWEFEEARQSIQSLFSRLKVNLISAFEVKNICIQIYYICSRIRLKKKLPQLETDLLSAISSCTTIGQLELVVNRMFEREKELLMTQGKEWNPLNEKAVQYIHAHLDEPLNLEMIASHVHVNPSHLSRIFKKDCGESMTEYINKVRIEKAKELLLSANSLAYEVAEQVGFHDPAYFSAIFKKYTGVSPKEYKNIAD